MHNWSLIKHSDIHGRPMSSHPLLLEALLFGLNVLLGGHSSRLVAYVNYRSNIFFRSVWHWFLALMHTSRIPKDKRSGWGKNGVCFTSLHNPIIFFRSVHLLPVCRLVIVKSLSKLLMVFMRTLKDSQSCITFIEIKQSKYSLNAFKAWVFVRLVNMVPKDVSEFSSTGDFRRQVDGHTIERNKKFFNRNVPDSREDTSNFWVLTYIPDKLGLSNWPVL